MLLFKLLSYCDLVDKVDSFEKHTNNFLAHNIASDSCICIENSVFLACLLLPAQDR